MLRSIHIENFKSLVNFSADFNTVTALIGNNSVGKSSLLQAMQFVFGSIKDDYDVLLKNRALKVENIKSKLTKNNKIKFDLSLAISADDGSIYDYKWRTDISANNTKNEMSLLYECIEADGEVLIEYSPKDKGHLYVKPGNEDFDGDIYFGDGFVFKSSVLKNLNKKNEFDKRLTLFIEHASNFMSFEMLNPDNMRQSSRGLSDVIGPSGKNLPSYIKKMSDEQKNSFIKKIKWLLGDRVSEIGTVTTGQYHWTQITVKEEYKDSAIKITSRDLSDGMLRIIAVVAISEISRGNAIFLFDEVENGINIHYIEKLVQLFKDMCKDTGNQVIFTTHSTLFMDYIDADSILMFERNENGGTEAKKIFATELMKKRLNYMYPGEIILNLESNAISGE
ncbi:AAA family ATPase [Butyrivibrio sp. AC2005]|uniref:AAA family ATPase n=1 Tax=Butyrivibrio sp. AC2005 TaxID=1280672 RepID=UPI0003FA4C30|nr:ATP-binding protein [Butyrivibrio sp. AC2005]